MEAAKSQGLRNLPVWTLLICSAAALVFFIPALQQTLVYNRSAISNGEWWRLISGNLVHHTTPHFACNLLAFFVAGAIAELQRYRHFGILCLSAGLAIGITLYATAPELQYFGGLSGMVTAAVIFLCLHGLQDAGWWRWLCLTALVCITTKLGFELTLGISFIVPVESQMFVPVPESHLVGAVIAILVIVITHYKWVFKLLSNLQDITRPGMR